MNRRRKATSKEPQVSQPVLAGFFLFCIATAFVILMLTGYTYQLDDIKIVGMNVGGGLCLLAWAILWMFDKVDLPPKPVWITYVAYLVVCLVSTLTAEDFAHWIGWRYQGFYIACFGFFLLGSSVIQNRQMLEWALKFWALITFVTTAFGLAHYGGVLEPVYEILYPGGRPSTDDRFHDVLRTFVMNRSMLSTVLNTQFFGNFLLMLLPVTAALVMVTSKNLRQRLEDGDSMVSPFFWSVISALGVVFSIACIFLTYSKSSWVFLPFVVVAFLLGIYLFAGVRKIPHFWLMLVLMVVMAATVLSFVGGDLRDQFKDIDQSLGPRSIIFGGAFEIFKDYPVVGGGPGSFRLLFPEYRSPDYHLNRVSNVTLYAHNWLLDLLAETGVLGTIAYLSFLGVLAWLAYRALRQSTDVLARVAIIGCGIGILSILAGASVTPMTRWPVGMVSLHAMLGTFLGISTYTLTAATRPEALSRRSHATPRPAGNDPLVPAKYTVALSALVFLVVTWNWSTDFFRAMTLHNRGIRNTEFVGAPRGELQDERFRAFYQRGAESFNEALELNPAEPTTYYKLGNAYNRLGNQQAALETYTKLKEYAPDYSEVHFNVAVIHFNLALEAREEAQRARSQGNDAQYQERIEETRSHFRSCVEAFEKAAEQSNKISVQFYRANTLMMALDSGAFPEEEEPELYKKAGDNFLRVTELPVATVIQEEGQVRQEKNLRFRSYRLAADAYKKADRPLLAAEATERYLDQVPTNLNYITQTAELYQQGGEPEEALRVVNEALEKNPVSIELLRKKFQLLAETAPREEAIEFGKYAVALSEQLSNLGYDRAGDSLRNQLIGRLNELTRAQEEQKEEEE